LSPAARFVRNATQQRPVPRQRRLDFALFFLPAAGLDERVRARPDFFPAFREAAVLPALALRPADRALAARFADFFFAGF
jgi:hypothetical protein